MTRRKMKTILAVYVGGLVLAVGAGLAIGQVWPEASATDVAPTCVDEYESTDCYYTQGEQTWYVDAAGIAHEVTE